MDRVESAKPAPPASRGASFWIGSVGLSIVMVVETVSVIGRHIGWPLLGALELIQSAILIAACAAMVSATASDAHASVHLVIDRLSPGPRAALLRLGALLSALFFAGLLVGSLVLVRDTWTAHERSELLGIPYPPLRIAVALAALAIALLFVRRAMGDGARVFGFGRSRPR